MELRVLEKLEWPTLVGLVAELTQTEEAKALCLQLTPGKSRAEIESRWGDVVPLRDLCRAGYRAPIGALVPMQPIFKAATVGHILAGIDLRAVYDLQMAIKKVAAFANDLQLKCLTLRKLRSQIYPLPLLLAAIEKTVAPDGALLDSASEELQSIRRQKITLRKRIEDAIKKLLRDSEVEQYLQDDFFTVRSDRYVIPLRLDGRGRIRGAIIDTSDSGQTLFLEPTAIQPLNEQLLELDVAEKLEILRIFRDLTAQVAQEIDILRRNYDELIKLDHMSAEAAFAAMCDAGPATIIDRPVIKLNNARHPLIRQHESNTRFRNVAIGNQIHLEPDQTCLVISGPNAGGKTVVLKTVGLLHIMASSGLLLPVDESSELFLYDRIYVEMGDAQNLHANLSTFSGHIHRLKPIIDKASSRDLVLLDELAVGTEPETGSAIAQAVLEHLASRNVTCLATTHFDSLKGLAVGSRAFRNGSMEYSLTNLRPTYRLILDVPGQSYGLEVAAQMGLPASIVNRARQLRGTSASALDAAVTQLMVAKDELRTETEKARRASLEAAAEKQRWQDECEHLDELRGKAAKQLAARYENQIEGMKERFEETLERLKTSHKEALQKLDPSQAGHQMGAIAHQIGAEKQAAAAMIRGMEQTVAGMVSDTDRGDALPGRAATIEDIQPNSKVFVIPLRQIGSITSTDKSERNAEAPIEVQVGIVKLRVSLHDLRIVGDDTTPKRSSGPPTKHTNTPKAPPKLVLQTATNACDLRGFDVDQAVDKAFIFIDKALLRGEAAVVLIHGHGTDRLKTAIRKALKDQCPYDVTFRPGEANEGGDGVTIVGLTSH